MTTRVTKGARLERQEKRETTRKARENGFSRSTDFWRKNREVLRGQGRES